MVRLLWPFVFKLGSKPAGIWLAWAALGWAAGLELRGAWDIWGICDAGCLRPFPYEMLISWPLLLGAGVALLLRRHVAVSLAGMALVSVVQVRAADCCPFGIALAALGFVGLLANRRWFDERLPRIAR